MSVWRKYVPPINYELERDARLGFIGCGFPGARAHEEEQETVLGETSRAEQCFSRRLFLENPFTSPAKPQL